jgi:hypothetical protein
VTDTHNELVTSVADGVVHLVAPWREFHLNVFRQFGANHSSREAVHWMVTVLVLGEAGLAEVKVLAISAVEKLLFSKSYARSV